MVERADALDRPERDPLGERAVAPVEPGGRRDESTIGVGVLLERP